MTEDEKDIGTGPMSPVQAYERARDQFLKVGAVKDRPAPIAPLIRGGATPLRDAADQIQAPRIVGGMTDSVEE